MTQVDHDIICQDSENQSCIDSDHLSYMPIILSPSTDLKCIDENQASSVN